MALDDSIFKSAIARINRSKAKSSIPQVLVFEDPPHLKKPNDTQARGPIEGTTDREQDAVISRDNNSLDQNRQPKIENDVMADRFIDRNIVHKSSTKQGTESSTKQGTENFIARNRVHKSSTKQGTKKGTEIAYNFDQNNEARGPLSLTFVYQRPYDSLSGIPKKIVDIIFELCRKYGGTDTPPIPLAMLVKLCNQKKNSVKVARQRLLEEGIILTKTSSDTPAKGRSGMLIYKLRDDIFQEISDSLSLFTRMQDLPDKKGTKCSTEKGTRPPSSSSLINTTTTTTMPDEWKKIDPSPLASINFGMTEIKNIYRKCAGKINPLVVQDSINQFAFGLDHNPDRYKRMNAPSGVLVKTLSEGIPWKETGYVSMAEKLELEKERKVIELLEKQIKGPKFLEWFNQLTEEERDGFVPNSLKGSAAYVISKSIIEKEQAKRYFDQTIWPELIIKLKMEFLQH